MPAQNIIELGFNIDELTAEKKQVLDLIVDLFGKLHEYDGTKFNPLGGGGLADLKKSIADGAQAMAAFGQTAQKYNEVVAQQYQKQQAAKKSTDDLSAAMKEHQKILDQIAQAKARANAASTDAGKAAASEYQTLRQRNAELVASAKSQIAEANSINAAKAAVVELTLQRNKQNTTTDEGRAKVAELNAEINRNNELIRENGSNYEQRKINIGNYADSLSPAFSSVKEQLEAINAQIAAMETKAQGVQNYGARTVIAGFGANQHNNQGPTALAGGQNVAPVLAEDADGYARLNVQGKILQGLLDRQTIGFKNVNQEMRAVKNTIDALELAGGKNTEVFEQLNAAYTTSEQKLKDLHREQTILTGDAPAITALTGVARGLGGAYAVGASASTLFADGNEKVEKELNKLVALMTFLQGLEEATATLKNRNAIVTALEAEATKALNIVKAIEIKLFGESKVAQVADAAATTENTAATISNTEATVAEGAAMEATEGAAIGLGTALVALGIGAIIVAVGVLIAKIVEWSEAENKAAEASAGLAEAMEKVNEILEERIRLSDEDADHAKKNLENAETLAEKNKQAYDDIYSVKKAIADLDAQTAQHDLKKAANTNDIGAAYRMIDGQVKSLTAGLDPLLAKQEKFTEMLNLRHNAQITGKFDTEEAIRLYKKYGEILTESDATSQLASVQKQIDATKKVIEGKKKLTDAYNQSQINSEALLIEKQQHDAEEQRQLILSTATTEADLIKAKNQLILNDDRSTLAQRLEALKSNAAEEKAIIEAGLKEQLSRPDAKNASGKLTTQSLIALQKAGEEEKKIAASSQAEIYKTIVDWNDKKLTFLNDIAKNELEIDAVLQQGISSNETKELDVRLSAIQKNIDDKTQIILSDYALQLKLAIEHNKTQEEFDKIESDRQKALAELTTETAEKIYETTLNYGEKRRQAIENQNKANSTTTGVDNSYNQEIDNLNKALLSQSISYQKYISSKKKLDEQYLLDHDRAEVADDEKNLALLTDELIKENAIKLEFANRDLAAAKLGGNDRDIANAQAKVDALRAIRAKDEANQTAAADKLNKDKQKLDDDSVSKSLAAAKMLHDKQKELQENSFDLAQGLVDASYEKRIEQLQHETELADQASQEQISAVQRSALSSRQQAEEVAILQAQQRARDTAAAKEERDQKIAEAKFDRDIAVAKAIWAGAQAEIAAIAEYDGTPSGFAIAAVIAALTAVQVATILSKPIPSYAEGIGIPGKGQHPGGIALTGEEGPERISIPGRQPFIVDGPTLLDLPVNSVVEPLNKGIITELADIGMSRSLAIFNNSVNDDRVERAILNQTSRLERALKRSQRKIINVINLPSETAGLPLDYYNRKILGKKK